MQYTVEYTVSANAEGLIEKHRPDHLSYRMKLKNLRLVLQIRSERGDMIGSVIVIDASDMADAEAIARGDPYIGVGVYDTVIVRPCEVRFCDLKVGPAAS